MNRLRTLLKSVGDVNVKFEDYWVLEIGENVAVDYRDYIRLREELGKDTDKSAFDTLSKFLNIAYKGKFLDRTDYVWLDQIKVIVEDEFVKCCKDYSESLSRRENYDLMARAGDTILRWDEFNELGISLKITSSYKTDQVAAAKEKYEIFKTKYENELNVSFGRDFDSLILK